MPRIFAHIGVTWEKTVKVLRELVATLSHSHSTNSREMTSEGLMFLSFSAHTGSSTNTIPLDR
ncbi:hypothetical protein PISMIDRAFT_690036 [Pisolithus microcarpus 441]|uniref:Uncharacterized protein n=1 Tax=Pisolithus microcarpus 441 TaxID=765257 RepID=A0A0C9Y3X4_9AGAM|nr:hypothetical protein PISMIDRAFT_690036 [Pisolithus microcarpus 441]